jgi:hypothetical protein
VGGCRDGAGYARTSSRPCYAPGDRSAFAAERQIVSQMPMTSKDSKGAAGASLYEDRYLAFVDVLGWKNIVSRSVSDPSVLPSIEQAADIISRAPDWARRTNEAGAFSTLGPVEIDARVSHFSDTFVLSFPGNPVSEGPLLTMLKTLCAELLNCGHYTRGAVVRGDLCHTDRVLFGPAVIEAHDLEQNVAKYPRILIAPRAESLFEMPDAIRTDTDGLLHVDILRMYKPSRADVLWLEGRLAMVEQKERDARGDLRLLSKHRWLKGYITEILDRARNEVTG